MSKLDKEDELEMEELENNYEAIMANDEINLEEREIYGSIEAHIEHYYNQRGNYICNTQSVDLNQTDKG